MTDRSIIDHEEHLPGKQGKKKRAHSFIDTEFFMDYTQKNSTKDKMLELDLRGAGGRTSLEGIRKRRRREREKHSHVSCFLFFLLSYDRYGFGRWRIRREGDSRKESQQIAMGSKEEEIRPVKKTKNRLLSLSISAYFLLFSLLSLMF
jgi:hypothetical protein